MCWPLRVQERTIGALAVNRAADRPRYTVTDLDQGQPLTSLLALVISNHQMHVERDNRIVELSTLNAAMQRMNASLEDAQNQVIQAEKLASIGQISAGVAHEINNPVAFVLSNLTSLESYVDQICELLNRYDHRHLFDPLLAGKDVLTNMHANTTIPKLVGALKRYTVFMDNPALYATLTSAEKAALPMYRQSCWSGVRLAVHHGP